jgi:hypothetical protein
MGLTGSIRVAERTDGGLSLTSDELLYLAKLFGVEPPLGIDSPYNGWLPGEIEAAQSDAIQSLRLRGLLINRSGAEFLVESPAARMMATCAAPKVALLTRVELPAGYEAISNFYWSYAEMIVELTTMHGSDQHHLVPFEPVDDVLYRLSHRLGWSPAMAPGLSGGTFERQAITDARSLAIHADVSAARQRLQQAGLTRSLSSRLAEAIANPVSVARILVVSPEENRREEFQVVEEQCGLWWFSHGQGDQEKMTQVVPLSTSDALQRLRAAVLSMKKGS